MIKCGFGWIAPNRDSESEKISRRWYGSSSDVSEILIDDRATQGEAMMIGLVPWILIRCPDWSMIPLENLVASSRGTGTVAIAIAKLISMAFPMLLELGLMQF